MVSRWKEIRLGLGVGVGGFTSAAGAAVAGSSEGWRSTRAFVAMARCRDSSLRILALISSSVAWV